MDLHTFKTSLEGNTPPDGLQPALQAVWYEAKGDWQKAHEIAQEENNSVGAWVHAYLHRKEGDKSNASYWYRRAGRTFPQLTSDEEWPLIVEELLREKS